MIAKQEATNNAWRVSYARLHQDRSHQDRFFWGNTPTLTLPLLKSLSLKSLFEF